MRLKARQRVWDILQQDAQPFQMHPLIILNHHCIAMGLLNPQTQVAFERCPLNGLRQLDKGNRVAWCWAVILLTFIVTCSNA